MKMNIAKLAMLALLVLPIGLALQTHAAEPQWNVGGNYVVNFDFLGTAYPNDISLVQDSSGNLTGTSGFPAGGPYEKTWVLVAGKVSGSEVTFTANYTYPAEAVTPLTVLNATGTVAANGSITGVWSDNYQGSSHSGTWSVASGTADMLGSLAAEDFAVVNYDTGLGILKGYTAGFGLTDATFKDVQSVVVKLYSGATLLQTNTATAKVGDEITRNQISSPFDVSGSFNYAADGYWTNVRESQYGQSVPATRVVATVTLENGKVVTAENLILSGDPTTIYPPVTPPGTGPTHKDQCKKYGWKSFTNPSFKNQGQCVSSVANGK